MRYKFLLSFFLLAFISFGLAGNQYFLDFDGSDDYVRYTDDATLGLMDGATDYTIEAWIYVKPGWSQFDRVLERYSLWRIYLNSNNRISFGIDQDSDDDYDSFYHTVDNVFTENEWTHIAIIRDTGPDPNTFKIYINGVDKSDGTWSGYEMKNENSRNLYIGQKGDGNYFFNGYIDEVRIKNVAENINDIHFHKNDPEYESDDNTAVLLHFDEGSGSYTVNEASGVNARLGGTGEGDAAEPTWRVWNYNGSDLSLPVELNAFTALTDFNSVLLKWSTASEVENVGFIVQRSMHKEGPFTTLASYRDTPSLKGAGNSSQEHRYSYTDRTVQTGQSYWYQLEDVSYSGARQKHGPVFVTVKSRDDALQPISGLNGPKQFKLYHNYPNPFNPETQIRLDIPQNKDGQIDLKVVVFNINGKQVRTLYNGAVNGGQYRLKWNGQDDLGHPLPSGVYILSVKAGTFNDALKMTLMR